MSVKHPTNQPHTLGTEPRRQALARYKLVGAGNRKSCCRQGTWGYRSGSDVSPLTTMPPDIAPLKIDYQLQERPSVVVVLCSHKKVPTESIAQRTVREASISGPTE